MSLKAKIKQNFLLFFITIVFVIWLVFLLFIGINASREVFFYDVLNDVDVSDQYISQVPFVRYFIEPICGLTFTIGVDFTWIATFILFFVILRITYVILRNQNVIKSKKFMVIAQIVKNYLAFALYLLLLVVLGVALYLLIGFLFNDFLF